MSQEMYASARQEGRGEKKLKTQTKFSQILNADKILIVPDKTDGRFVCFAAFTNSTMRVGYVGKKLPKSEKWRRPPAQRPSAHH